LFLERKTRRREDQRAMEAGTGAAGGGTRRGRGARGKRRSARRWRCPSVLAPYSFPSRRCQTHAGQSAPASRRRRWCGAPSPHQGSRGQHGLAGAPEARPTIRRRSPLRRKPPRFCATRLESPMRPTRCARSSSRSIEDALGRGCRRHRDGADRRSREAGGVMARRWRNHSHRSSLGRPAGFDSLCASHRTGGNRRGHSAARQPAHLRPHEPAQLHAVWPGTAGSRL